MFRIIPFITTRILTIHEIPHSFIAQSSIKISTFSAHGDETRRKCNIYPSKIIIFGFVLFLYNLALSFQIWHQPMFIPVKWLVHFVLCSYFFIRLDKNTVFRWEDLLQKVLLCKIWKPFSSWYKTTLCWKCYRKLQNLNETNWTLTLPVLKLL